MADTTATLDPAATASVSPPRAGAAPLAAAAASRLSVLCAVALVALGVLALRDTAISQGWLAGTPLLTGPAGALGGPFSPASWLVPAGAALAVVGLAVAVSALMPRRTTAVACDAVSAVYVSHGDVATAAASAAHDVAGVTRARATASRRRVTISCRTTESDRDAARRSITEAVTDELRALQKAPRVVVRIRTETPS